MKLTCMYCKKMTSVQKKRIQKKINNKIITLSNAPVHYCPECKESFISKEAIDSFSYIQSNGLENSKILFDFDDLYKKLGK